MLYNKQKIGVILVSCLVMSFYGFAQKHKVDKANNAYNNLNYISAIEIYTSVVESGVEDPKLILRLANSHYFNGNFNESVKWFERYYVLVESHPQLIDNYRYGQALKTKMEYKKADSLIATYYNYKGLRYRSIQDDKEQIIALDNSHVYLKEEFSLNTDLSEYPAFISNDVFYVVGVNLNNKKARSTNITSDIFRYDATNNSYEKLPEVINSSYNEGSLSITNDGKTMYFTRNDKKANSKGINTISIYIAELKNGNWRNVRPFPFNSEEYSVGHPTLSPDNKTLYFVSDKPGGKGGKDLYKIPVYDDGSFGEPKNMTALNTLGDEMFPFVDRKDGTLYFSSNGPKSLGGLDIFIAKLNSDNVYKRFYNLGKEINSTYDDIAFMINENRQGYFASNRINDVGMDDIYKFKALKDFEVPLYLKVSGKLNDEETQEPITGVALTIYDKNDNPLAHTITDEYGNYVFEEVEVSKIDYIISKKPTYQTVEKDVSKHKLINKQSIDLNMRALDHSIPEKIDIKGTLKDTQSDESISNATIILSDIDNNPIAKTKTNARGDYSFSDVPSEKLAFIRIDKNGYQTDEKEIDFNTLNRNTLSQDITLVKDKVALELGSDIASILNTIYFRYGQSDITPEAKVELQKIVQVLKRFPNVHIIIESHTDSQGTHNYNLMLSQKRAKATYDYLIRNGVNPKRLKYIGHGEDQILNRCVDGVECSDAEHQKNRRSAFKITKV